MGSKLDDQYLIEELLGQGGMGAVFRARHALLGHNVAIKVMSPKLSRDANYRALFLREGQAATLFHHANAVAVHDLRESREGIIYLVMEYLAGETLAALLSRRKKLTISETMALLTPIAAALGAAHARGVIHCDLKPSNILIGQTVDEQPVVKLLDLGIARINRDKSESSTTTEAVLGSPQYMSPEQWERRDDIDARTDIYSLAVIFYEALSGSAPFIEQTAESLAYQHTNVTSLPLHKIDPEIPKDFSLAIMRALAKNRANRPQSCQQFIEELEQGLKPAPAPQKPSARWSQRDRAVAVLMTFLMFIMVGSIVRVLNNRIRKRSLPAKPAIERSETNSAIARLARKNRAQRNQLPEAGEVAWSPAGRAFRSAPQINQYWEGQGSAREILLNNNREELSWQVECDLWFVLGADNNAVGEVELRYDAELRLHRNNQPDLVVKPGSSDRETQNRRRRYPIVGRRVGKNLIIELASAPATLPPIEISLRGEPSDTGSQLVMRKVKRAPLVPFQGSVPLTIFIDGLMKAEHQQAEGALVSEWHARFLPGQMRAISLTPETSAALARLKQSYP